MTERRTPLPPELKTLVEAERRAPPRPPADARLAVRQRLDAALAGRAAPTATAPHAGAGAPQTLGLRGLRFWPLAATFAAGTVAGALGHAALTRAPPIPTAPIDRPAVATTTTATNTTATPAPPPSVAAAPPATPLVVTPEQFPARTPPRYESLAAERSLLERARSALARGDATGALAAVGLHEKRYPHGTLAEEREALAVQALSELGNPEAKERAGQFHKRFPKSLLAPVVDAAVGGR